MPWQLELTRTAFDRLDEALEPGVVISDVARRHDVTPSQLFCWMRRFRDGALARRAPPEAPMFAPAVVDVAPVTMSSASSPVTGSMPSASVWRTTPEFSQPRSIGCVLHTAASTIEFERQPFDEE